MWRMRRSVRKRILFVGSIVAVQIILLIVCTEAAIRITGKKYETLVDERDAVIEAAGRTVYITKCAVEAGEVFTAENTERRYLLSEQNPEALANDIWGMRACADLQEGVIVNTALCCVPEYATSERICVFSNIGDAECFSEYDTVDVRLRYANGENYCVLKKKQLKKEEDGVTCGFCLTESEQLLMSAAVFDVDVYDGAELYLVGFMEARLQEDSVSEYVPSVQVIAQLQEWNKEYRDSFAVWCQRRTELERRLAEYQKLRMDGVL